ncbi:nitrogen fixation protein NifM [Propionivibrio sp.]|uniref:nitrogen fixation protein NifM n=1 Tax=Propionivibrio sp. TaxID=2212460 RepID=UPI0025EC041A|nr:nitrogen fixation protein NifM [Propionivibrio sp.]MBK8745402.1 nitrogen fixation protein NifM [Propionivibrio sp.]
MMQNGYLELKLSWQLFEKTPETLTEHERGRLLAVAAEQQAIEQCILASAEAAYVVVVGRTLSTRLAEIRKRYTSEEEFAQDLERIGMGEVGLARAVERDLRVDAVLEKVASSAAPVSAVDAEIFYCLHPEAFDRPESRRLRHILLTSSNTGKRARAFAQLETFRPSLTDAGKFGEMALRHSHCPTATEGGKLGVVKRGQLYPELEPAAFALAEGEVSRVLESPIGLHILRCDEILPGGLMPFVEVREKVIEHLSEQRRRKTQREWIKRRQLLRAGS